jgi:8-oxo-dGTP diphosphatase
MDGFKIITDKDFGLKEKEFDNPRIRYGARGIVLDNDGKIAILNKKNKNEYKLVGGGIDENETPIQAFLREVYEESGVVLQNEIIYLGNIEEHKSQDNFKQISYVYVGYVKEIKKTHFTKKEKDEGARIIWLTIEEAMKLIKESEHTLKASQYENLYHSKFIVKRDYEILKYYMDLNK